MRPIEATHPTVVALPDVGGARAGVTIVVPTYNEERGVGAFLTSLTTALEQLGSIPVEVLVINDGSTDATLREVTPFLGDRIKLIEHDCNRGYGAAIKTGVAHAHYPWILITDADGTYPCSHIEALLTNRGKHDMVVGARIGANRAVPWVRRPAKWFLRSLASWLSGHPIPDLNSGLRVVRKDLLERHAAALPNGFSLTTTITLILLASGHGVKFLAIDYLKREGRSKIRPVRDTLNFFQLILRTLTLFDPLRVFVPLAASFAAGAIAVGVGSYLAWGRVMDVVTVLLFVTGVQLLGMGVIADMINRRIR
jgi:glycosyltransferase involved in cell wall biosynthesis